MFTEHEIRMTPVHFFAIFLWSLAFIMWAVSWATDILYLSALAVLLSAAAGTTSVRGFFVTHQEHMRTAMRVTGRDGAVHTLHR